MKKRYSLLFVFLFLCSCQRTLYISNKITTAGFTGAKEYKADLSLRPQNGKQLISYALSAAYAPSEHLLVTGSFNRFADITSKEQIYNDSNVNDKEKFETTVKGYSAEIGAGYFKKLKNDGRLECIGGIGNGTMKCTGGQPPSFTLAPGVFAFDGGYNKAYAQIGYGIGNDKLAMITGARQSFIKYYRFNSINPNLKYSLSADGRADVTRHALGFFEPYFEGSAGWQRIKFTMQFSIPIQVSGPASGATVLLPYLGLGISYKHVHGPKTKKTINPGKQL